MTTAFALIAKVVTLRGSPRLLLYGFRNTLNRWLGTGDRRFEFERLYLEHGDFWNYRTSEYERQKYERTLASVLKWRRGSANALEVGCSVGVFTRMLANYFGQITAIDISREAVLAAAHDGRTAENVRFARRDIRELNEKVRYDLIVCAEVLYYIPKSDADLVLQKLGDALSERGIIITISGVPAAETEPEPFYFDGWNDLLAARFERLSQDDVIDAQRSYRIAVFARNVQAD